MNDAIADMAFDPGTADPSFMGRADQRLLTASWRLTGADAINRLNQGCQDKLSGLLGRDAKEALATQLGRTEFVTGGGPMGTIAVGEFGGWAGSAMMTIGEVSDAIRAEVARSGGRAGAAVLNSGTILLLDTNLSSSLSDVYLLVVHEMLHTTFGKNDRDLADGLELGYGIHFNPDGSVDTGRTRNAASASINSFVERCYR